MISEASSTRNLVILFLVSGFFYTFCTLFIYLSLQTSSITDCAWRNKSKHHKNFLSPIHARLNFLHWRILMLVAPLPQKAKHENIFNKNIHNTCFIGFVLCYVAVHSFSSDIWFHFHDAQRSQYCHYSNIFTLADKVIDS